METHTKLTKEQTSRFYSALLPLMKKLLANPTRPRNIRQKKDMAKPIEAPINNHEEIPSEVQKEELDDETIEISANSNKEMTKEDYIKILELLKTPSFAQMLSTLSVKEAVIISLKLGYIDGKYFSTKSISEFLGIEASEVIDVTKKILLVYKENLNTFLDKAIAIATDETSQDKKLSF